MGSSSAFHLGTLMFVLLIFVLVIFIPLAIIVVVLRAIRNNRSSEDKQKSLAGIVEDEAAAPVAVANKAVSLLRERARSTAQTTIAIVYFVGGAFGTITTLPQLNGVSLDLLSAFAWLILLTQMAAAFYGAWQFWNGKPIGSQLLYWLSWTCVPVVSFSALTYWCAMGLAVFPTVTLGLINFSFDFSFRFGYASQLAFNSDMSGLLVGANLVAVAFVLMLEKSMKQAGTPRWPLVLQNT